MPIYRQEKKRGIAYTRIINASLQDKRLSWKARGILSYMLSKPDNFKFHLDMLAEEAPDGLDSVKAGVKELEQLGYVKRYPIKVKGKIVSWNMDVYEKPQMDFPQVEKPLVENPTLITNDLITNELNKKDLNNTSLSTKPTQFYLIDYDLSNKEYIEEALATYYGHYQRKTSKNHPKLKEEQLTRIYNVLGDFISEYSYLDEMIKEFFSTVKSTDYNINHFATEGMLQILVERVR